MPMTPIQYLLTPFYGGYQLYFIPTLTASIAALVGANLRSQVGGCLLEQGSPAPVDRINKIGWG
jgi:hypothetical protein